MMEAEYRRALRRQAIHQAQRRRATPPAASPPHPPVSNRLARSSACHCACRLASTRRRARCGRDVAAAPASQAPQEPARRCRTGAVQTTVVDLTQTTDEHSSVDALVLAEISKFESLTLDIGTQVRCVVRPQLRLPRGRRAVCPVPTVSAPWPVRRARRV